MAKGASHGKMCSIYWPLFLIVSLFFLWGFANNINDILIKQFTKTFSLLDWQAGLVQAAFYIGYCFGAWPAAMVTRKFGHKVAVMAGLCLFAAGSLWIFPVARFFPSYHAFLAGLFLIAFGLAFLETSANPWILALGTLHGGSDFATRALNIAQAFNPLGAMTGIVCGRIFILDGSKPPTDVSAAMTDYRQHQAAAIGVPYLALGVIVASVACAFGQTKFPTEKEESREGNGASIVDSVGSGSRLIRNWSFVKAVLAQFFYIAAQVSIWSFLIRYAILNVPDIGEQRAADLLVLSLVVFTLGRFVSSALLIIISGDKLLCMYALLACATCAAGGRCGGKPGVVFVCATNMFMSMMYPTIFALALECVGQEDKAVAASALVMALAGGAVAPPIMGAVSDATSMTKAYFVPAVCFLPIALFAASVDRPKANQLRNSNLEEVDTSIGSQAATANVYNSVA